MDCPFIWYKNVAGRFFGLVTKHACDRQTDRRTDGQTDRITTPKTALAQLRGAVKPAQNSAADTVRNFKTFDERRMVDGIKRCGQVQQSQGGEFITCY